MIAGNPDKFAFIAEKVSDWGGCGYVNGLMYLYINGVQYPKETRTVTLNMELYNLTDKNSPLVNPVTNEELFEMDKNCLFAFFCRETFDKGSCLYQLPFSELEDAGYYAFIISSQDKVRIQLGRYAGTDDIRYTDETIIDKKELIAVINELNKIKEQV